MSSVRNQKLTDQLPRREDRRKFETQLTIQNDQLMKENAAVVQQEQKHQKLTLLLLKLQFHRRVESPANQSQKLRQFRATSSSKFLHTLSY